MANGTTLVTPYEIRRQLEQTGSPDVMFCKGFFTLAEQKKIYDKVLSIEPGFYVPVLKNRKRMNLQMKCFGWDWSARTYLYSKVREDEAKVAPMPAFLRAVARGILKETNYWQGPGKVPAYDICVANLYDEEGGKLGLHPDNSESEESVAKGYPVISLSIGASAIFTIGAEKKAQVRHVLESGDVVLFGRSMRLAYHGVKRIVCGTTPPELEFAKPGRLNLTFRIL
jgi:alkylated DNA repair protein (DNA oxidative demethylase)